MIRLDTFNAYTDEHWTKIREQVLDDLGVDVDQITRQITRSLGKHSITATQPLRDRIEVIVSAYHVLDASNRQKPRRDELDALRTNAKNMHASIINALAVEVGTKLQGPIPWLRTGVDADMLDATREYFRRLARNLDRQIEQAGSSTENARKTARNNVWSELLTVWIDIGGKPKGRAAARFLTAASKPVGADADIKTVETWLKRQSKTTKKVKAVKRRRAA